MFEEQPKTYFVLYKSVFRFIPEKVLFSYKSVYDFVLVFFAFECF